MYLREVVFLVLIGAAMSRVTSDKRMDSWKDNDLWRTHQSGRQFYNGLRSNRQSPNSLNPFSNELDSSSERWLNRNNNWASFEDRWSQIRLNNHRLLDANRQKTLKLRERYVFKHHNGIDVHNDYGWDRYPKVDFDKIRMPAIPPVAMPLSRHLNSVEWPEWLPPIRMVKLPLDTPPEVL